MEHRSPPTIENQMILLLWTKRWLDSLVPMLSRAFLRFAVVFWLSNPVSIPNVFDLWSTRSQFRSLFHNSLRLLTFFVSIHSNDSNTPTQILYCFIDVKMLQKDSLIKKRKRKKSLFLQLLSFFLFSHHQCYPFIIKAPLASSLLCSALL